MDARNKAPQVKGSKKWLLERSKKRLLERSRKRLPENEAETGGKKDGRQK